MTTQDSQGVVYIGNQHGVFKKTGKNWEYIDSTYNIEIHSIKKDPSSDKVFVGANGEFGYIETDNTGKSFFRSLKQLIQIKHQHIDKIFSIIFYNGSVYFVSSNAIYAWNREGIIHSISPAEDAWFGRVFVHQNKLITENRSKGLYELIENKLVPFLFNPLLEKDYIRFAVPWKTGATLLGSYADGLYFLTDKQLIPFKTDVDHLFKKFRIKTGIQLRNGHLAISFASYDESLVILNKDGELLFHSQDTKLINGIILNIFEDSENNLWLALHNGLSKIELNSPVIFDKHTGIDGQILDMTIQDDILYAATVKGLHRLDTRSPNNSFSKISPSTIYCKSLHKTVFGILVICDEEILLMSAGNVQSIVKSNKPLVGIKNTPLKASYLISHNDGLSLLTFKNNLWRLTELAQFNNTPFTFDRFSREDAYTYWFPQKVSGITKVKFEGDFKSAQITFFDHSAYPSLPRGYVETRVIDDRLIFSTSGGFLELNQSTQPPKFERSDIFNQHFGEHDFGVKYINKDLLEVKQYPTVGNRQSYSNQAKMYIGKKDGFDQYQWSSRAFARLPLNTWFNAIYDSPGYVWVNSDNHLYKVNYLQAEKKSPLAPPLITAVTELQTKNRLPLLAGRADKITLAFENNSVQFDYALPYFIEEHKTLYQTQLTGHSNNWSEWSDITSKEYSSLPEGTYGFKIRARTIYGDISPVRTYAFTVFPPWYRSLYAYIAYALIFFTVLILGIRLYTANLRKKAQHLEATVTERTQQVSELLEQKNTLFTNISHELRTPITLILGPADKILKNGDTTDNISYVKVIKRNGIRLLRLVEQLLSIAKISSIPYLERKQYAIKPLIDFILSSFQPLTEEKNIQLSCNDYSDTVISMAEDALEKIVINLISNAIKYTPDNGKIGIDVTVDKTSSVLTIIVTDTGPGIPEAEFDNIFERFNRLDNPALTKVHGTGIGLSLVKDLVEAHNGQIHVNNGSDHGAVFTVSLPVVILSGQTVLNHPIPDNIHSTALDLELSTLSNSEPVSQPVTLNPDDNYIDSDKTSILIIEDTTDMRAFLTTVFSHDYHCLAAEDGAQGIQLAKQFLPDLIISDLMMPGKNGYEVCHELKNDTLTCHIPIIILTAKDDFESRMQGWKEKADEYLGKPFSEEELRLRTENLISIRQTLKQRFSREWHQDESSASNPPKIIRELSQRDQDLIKKFNTVLEKNFSDSEFGLIKAAKAVAMSERQLQRKLKALLDHHFREYLRTYRLKKAKEYLSKGQSISNVIGLTGFTSNSYFTQCFKAEFGITPKQHQNAE